MVTRQVPAHPHGWFGYAISDPERTRNAMRLARWPVAAGVLVVAIVAGAVVALALISPLAVAALFGGGSVAAGGTVVTRRWRRPK